MSITEAAAGRRTAKADAMEFLRAALVGAPVPAAELSRVAHERGLTPKAIRSAREALGVKIDATGSGRVPSRYGRCRVSTQMPTLFPFPQKRTITRKP